MPKSHARILAHVECTQATTIKEIVAALGLCPTDLCLNLYQAPAEQFPVHFHDIGIRQIQRATISHIVEWPIPHSKDKQLVALLSDCEWITEFRENIHQEMYDHAEIPLMYNGIVLSTCCPEGTVKHSDVQRLKGLSIAFNRYSATHLPEYVVVEFNNLSAIKEEVGVEALPQKPFGARVWLSNDFKKYLTYLYGSQSENLLRKKYLNCIEFQSSSVDQDSSEGCEVEVFDIKGVPLPLVYKKQLTYTPDPFWITLQESNSRLMATIKISFHDFTTLSDQRFILKAQGLNLSYLINF